MKQTWLGVIGLGMALATVSCVATSGASGDPAGAGDPAGTSAPAAFVPGPARIDATDDGWIVGRPHQLQVTWRQAPEQCSELYETCSPVTFTVTSAQCTHCNFIDDHAGVPKDGIGYFNATPDAVGDVKLTMSVLTTDHAQQQTVQLDATADAYRALDVRCYVLRNSLAVPCSATRTADDRLALWVRGAMVSGRILDLPDRDVERITVDGAPTSVTSVEVSDPHSLWSYLVVPSPSHALGRSAVVTWIDPAGTKFESTAAIPPVAP